MKQLAADSQDWGSRTGLSVEVHSWQAATALPLNTESQTNYSGGGGVGRGGSRRFLSKYGLCRDGPFHIKEKLGVLPATCKHFGLI